MRTYLYWPVAVLLMGFGQGLLLPAIRLTPPGSEARRQALALHYVLVASYYLPLVLVPATWLAALGARLLLFDLVLNAASGKPLFYVGQTAAADKAWQALAARTHWPAERWRALGWAVCLGLTTLWLLLLA